jgi:hypothetical protein
LLEPGFKMIKMRSSDELIRQSQILREQFRELTYLRRQVLLAEKRAKYPKQKEPSIRTRSRYENMSTQSEAQR